MEEKDGKYEKLLAGVIAARATSFLFNKLLLADMEPLNLLAVRFLIAFAVLVLLFRREMRAVKRETVQRGPVLCDQSRDRGADGRGISQGAAGRARLVRHGADPAEYRFPVSA